MAIFPKLSSDTLVPLFQPKRKYYLINFPKVSSDTLGVPSDLIGQFCQMGKVFDLTQVSFLYPG